MKFIFLDRDGVINREPREFTNTSYVTRWEDFHFLPGSLLALHELTKRGYQIVIVSNQAGVSRGIYTKAALDSITRKMVSEIESHGGKLYSVQYCIHINEDNCDCKKPKTGLVTMATQGQNVDFSKTYLVGDAERDIVTGKRLGCKTILVLTGKTRGRHEADDWQVKPDFIVNDLNAATKVVE